MQKWTISPARPIRIAFMLFDQFSNLCLANCMEPLRAANTLTDKDLFSWQIFTISDAAVHSSSGMRVLPHSSVAQLRECDYLYVLASYGHTAHDDVANRRKLRAAAKASQNIVGLDAAPWLLASAGLLEGRKATLHWDLLETFSERFLNVEAERTRVVRDGPLITCAGAMSALEFSLDQISTHAGIAARMDVEALFIYSEPDTGDEIRIGNIRDPLVRKAVNLMKHNVESALTLSALSKLMSCQPRTLDRRFRTSLAAPPGAVYRHIRLSAARKLLDEGQLGVAEIAVRCGYESPAALTRAIRQKYGGTPTQLKSGRQLGRA